MLKLILVAGVLGFFITYLVSWVVSDYPNWKEGCFVGVLGGLYTALVTGLILVLLTAAPKSFAQDLIISSKILVYLEAVGCRPSTEVIQSIKVDPNHRFYGSYSDGQIIIRSLEDERTLVHELYHSCQKKATNYNEWWLNEIEAKGIEMKWVNRGK